MFSAIHMRFYAVFCNKPLNLAGRNEVQMLQIATLIEI